MLQGDDDNAVKWAFHFYFGNEEEPGMVKGCCTASGAVEVTIIARAASTRPGQGAEVGKGDGWEMVGFTKCRINVLICAVRPWRKAGVRLASHNFNHRRGRATQFAAI
jgi:hypothetical protein